MRIIPLVAMAALTAIFFINQAPAADYAPEVGQRHPDFTLPNIASGEAASLSDFRGKKVLLVQFASW